MNEKIKESDINISLDEGTATWNLNFHGQIQGTYLGLFKFRCSLNPIQYIEADKDYRELLGPNASLVGTHTDSLAYALSQLKQRILEAPPFWNEKLSRFGGAYVPDHEVIDLVLEASVQSEIKYRKLLTKRHEEAIEKLKKAVEQQKANQELTSDGE